MNIFQKATGLKFLRRKQAPINNLRQMCELGNNFIRVPETDGYPEHAVAFGLVKYGNTERELRTAFNFQRDDVEVSSLFGRLPNSPMGWATTDRLNGVLRGKYLTQDSDNVNELDLLHVTHLPLSGLTRETINRAIQTHAERQAIVAPTHCVNIEWDTPSLEFSVECEAKEDYHDTKTGRQNQPKWHKPGPKAGPGSVAQGQTAQLYSQLQTVGAGRGG